MQGINEGRPGDFLLVGSGDPRSDGTWVDTSAEIFPFCLPVVDQSAGARLFALHRTGSLARRWRAADGGPSRRRPAAEESPLSGKHGVGWEPDGRESEQRSRNDTARWHHEGVAPEHPSGSGETADSPGASPNGRDEPFSRPSRRARSRMLPETKRGLLPRPGRPVGNGGPLSREGLMSVSRGTANARVP